MKHLATTLSTPLPEALDIRQPEHAARLSEAFVRERDAIRETLTELETVRYADRSAREATAMATMLPMPGHDLMDRAPHEILRMRAALILLSYHAHRRN